MKIKLKMKRKNCGQWNRIEVEKVFLNPDNPEPKVQVFLSSFLVDVKGLEMPIRKEEKEANNYTREFLRNCP